eukprot:3950083-Alexandrium_andersonii.AAC.1
MGIPRPRRRHHRGRHWHARRRLPHLRRRGMQVLADGAGEAPAGLPVDSMGTRPLQADGLG